MEDTRLKPIPIFYNPAMVASTTSFSPSASKSRTFVNTAKRELGPAIEVITSAACRPDHLKAAHATSYVDGVMTGALENGFGNNDLSVMQALPYQVGSLLDACTFVAGAERGANPVAVSPSSGFHHAHFDEARGFCTFNGLVIAAMALKRAGLVRRVGILDYDYHYGDGTDDIIDHLKLGDWLHHFSAGSVYKSPEDAHGLIAEVTRRTKEFFFCDLVIYQAGADQHVDDPLGGVLTSAEMAQRDRSVFWACREYNIPLVWNLAGGYQRDVNGTAKPVIDLHLETLRQCRAIYQLGQDRKVPS